jgi:hypothetical protein
MSLPIIYPSGVGKHTMDAIPNSMFQPLDRSLPFLLPWSCNLAAQAANLLKDQFAPCLEKFEDRLP